MCMVVVNKFLSVPLSCPGCVFGLKKTKKKKNNKKPHKQKKYEFCVVLKIVLADTTTLDFLCFTFCVVYLELIAVLTQVQFRGFSLFSDVNIFSGQRFLQLTNHYRSKILVHTCISCCNAVFIAANFIYSYEFTYIPETNPATQLWWKKYVFFWPI